MKIKAHYETEVYISEGGYYCIKQVIDDQEMLVILTPYQMEVIAKDMKGALVTQSEWWNDCIDEVTS